MPVRSLASSVLIWPDATTVDQAVRRWARQVASQRDGIQRIGYFGSYARGDWGVGSDLDLVIILKRAEQPFERRAAAWDTTALPVPTDVLVYTTSEWDALSRRPRAAQPVKPPIVWVYPASPG